MKEKLLYVVGFIVFAGCVMYPYFSSADLYAKQSHESRDLCLKHSIERDESPDLCGHMEMSADTAYYSARRESGSLNILIILMFAGFCLLAYKVRSLSRELNEFQDKSNV